MLTSAGRRCLRGGGEGSGEADVLSGVGVGSGWRGKGEEWRSEGGDIGEREKRERMGEFWNGDARWMYQWAVGFVVGF
ncbi:hypothetical protein RHMOL_Rhmol08G0312600 [Rhododendron molle]|uniref:Uncharacterized protein n=1 Tax=Rhododendron molle TaxID=49168 RepID=A0ACC0MUQ3_RHOML|nr:hypothetical protein RHMOL_Rhmol08G0312600 [Rhododendron molle]